MPNRFFTSLDQNIIFLLACSLDHLRQRHHLPTRSPPSFCQQCQGNIVAAYMTLWPVFPAPHKACFFCVIAMMPRKKGSVNYKNELLINIVADVLPNGEYGWQTIALAYQEQLKEEILHHSADMKKHWIKVLCNGMKKPMGWMREAGDRIHRCMASEKNIKKKTIQE
jgi:hypothetical protein